MTHNAAGRSSATADHVLRTFAAVPVGQRVLELGGTRYGQAGPLTQLGFEVHVCSTDETEVKALRESASTLADRIIRVPRLNALGYPDAYFDWIVLLDAPEITMDEETLVDLLQEARRVLKPGGWIYATLASSNPSSPQRLVERMDEAGLALAEAPKAVEEAGRCLIRGIFRRVEPGTPV